MKRITSVFLLFLLFSNFTLESQVELTTINYAAFYKAFASTDIKLIDSQLSPLLKVNKDDSKAYAGALLMKKAGFVSSVIDKLEFFKAGKNLLEAAMTKNPNNFEYSFLRLAIQENCPDFLGYNGQISADSKRVINNFNLLPTEVKSAILEYSKTSKALPTSSLIKK